MLDTPVVLIAFNRPDLTQLTLDRIREVAPAELFMVVDGPRPDRPDDAARCAAVREVLDSADWPCTVHRRYSEVNLGCEANIELGLDWVFEHVERAIIVEDDCVPDPSFFRYCAELLEHYDGDPRIWQIAGNTLFGSPEDLDGASYTFSAFASVWGWATWRRAWQLHRARFPRGQAGVAEPVPATRRAVRQNPPTRGLVSGAGRRYFADVATSTTEREFSWDSYWWLSMIYEGGLAVTPAYNLVQNHGFREDATYTRSSRPSPASQAMPFPLVHPTSIGVNAQVESELERVLVRAAGRFARRAKRYVPAGPIRRPLRLAADLVSWLAKRARRTPDRVGGGGATPGGG